MSKKLTSAVGYLRMSSGKQEKSPTQQRAEILKLAKREGYKVIRWYSDEAISGDATEKREGFKQMIADAEDKGDFCAILCWDQDRFGRFDSVEAGRWIYPLREAGVWLVTCGQGMIDWNDFAGRMMYSIQQEGKHQFLIDLSRNVLRGKIESAKKGRGSSIPPWGYDREFRDDTGKVAKRVPYGEKFTKPRGWHMRFVISEDTKAVETVRWMFDTFANADCGYNRIAENLNRRNILSPTKRKWSVQAVQRVLTNPTYTGANVFGRNRCGKYHHTNGDGEISRGNGRNAAGVPIVTRDAHDQLIDPETFDRVQEKIAERRSTNRRPRYSRYLLSGVLKCGHCGAPMVGKGYKNGNRPRYYACTTGNTRPGVCCHYQIQQEPIERFIRESLAEHLLGDDAIKMIHKAAHQLAKQKKGFSTSTKAIKTRIATLDTKIAKGTENLLLANPKDMAELSDLLGTWRDDRAKLQAELETMAANPDGLSPKARADKAVAKLQHVKEQIKTGDPEQIRAGISSTIEEITLWFEPHGKRNKRLARGIIRYRGSEVFSRSTKTVSATSSAAGTLIR